MDPVVVRPARPQEWDRAGELVATAYLADGGLQQGDPYLEHLRDAAGRARDSLVLVAADGDTLLGTVTWCPVPSSHREVARADEGEFRSLGVDPSARGRGIGRLLIEACVRRARQEGYAAVAISSAQWMGAAHRLYERMGFTRRPERDWAPRPDVPLLAYRLDLRQDGQLADGEDTAVVEPHLVAMDDGIRLRTWTTGKPIGHPPVVLLHGGPGLWDYLEPVATMLDPMTVVHRFDQRGCGGSDACDEHTVARYVADLEALRRSWGQPSWIVIGHSFGATLAFAYAAAHPARTTALGYLSGTGLGDWRTAYRNARRSRLSAEQHERLAQLTARRPRAVAEDREWGALSWFTDYANPKLGWELAVADARTPTPINHAANAALNAETDAWSDADVAAMAHELRMPCLFVHGADDPRPVSTVAALRRETAGAQLEVLTATGHWPWRERPERFREVLCGFVTARG